MATWTPDPTFYPSPRMAMQAPAEKLGYVAILNGGRICSQSRMVSSVALVFAASAAYSGGGSLTVSMILA